MGVMEKKVRGAYEATEGGESSKSFMKLFVTSRLLLHCATHDRMMHEERRVEWLFNGISLISFNIRCPSVVVTLGVDASIVVCRTIVLTLQTGTVHTGAGRI